MNKCKRKKPQDALPFHRMPPKREDRPDVRAVAIWAALLKTGAPAGQWVSRARWNQAVRAAAGVGSRPSINDHTFAAEEARLIEVERGAGARKGRVRLLEPGHPGQFVPGYTPDQLEELTAQA